MTRANKALVITVVATFGLWGCARGPVPGAGGAERIKALESKIGKLEDDYKATAAARDQIRQKLAAAEEQKAKLRKEIIQLQVVVKERDTLKNEVVVRTSERDSLQTQFEQFRKGIRELLGHGDAAAPSNPVPVAVGSSVAQPGKS